MKSLKERTVSGVKWQGLNKISQKIISVVTFAILARMLDPETFGLFAMAFIAIDGLSLFQTLGFDAGIVQKKNSTESTTHTAFVIILLSGIIIFFLGYLFAPLFAHLFKQPHLTPILRVLAFIFVLGGFGKVPLALLTKQMRFARIAVIQFVSSLTNCLLVILFALWTKTVWCLVWAYLIKQLITVILNWQASGYRFKWQFEPSIARELFHFGKFMVGLNIIWYINGNAADIIVGKLLGTAALGYFVLAGNISNFINTHFTQLISNVMFPAYAQLQNDKELLKRAYLKMVKFVSIFAVPFSVVIFVLAKEFTLTLYGAKWLPIVELIRLFAIAQLINPLLACSGSIFTGCGKPEYAYRIAFLTLLVRVPLVIFCTLRWGVFGACISSICVALLVAPFNFFLVYRLVGIRLREFFLQLVPSFYCSLIMAVSILAVKSALFLSSSFFPLALHHIFDFMVFAAVGLIAYVLAFFFVDRPATLEVKRMLFSV